AAPLTQNAAACGSMCCADTVKGVRQKVAKATKVLRQRTTVEQAMAGSSRRVLHGTRRSLRSCTSRPQPHRPKSRRSLSCSCSATLGSKHRVRIRDELGTRDAPPDDPFRDKNIDHPARP